MRYYQIIKNREEFNQFLHFLPDDSEVDGEQYFLTLFARKKYDKSGIVKADKSVLKRFTSKRNNISEKVEQLEVVYGSYKINRIPVPEDALALYINPNPRSFHKAGVGLLKELATMLGEGKIVKNPQSLAMSAIQASCARKIWFDIDVDFILPEQIPSFREYIATGINIDACTFIQTRGGCHLLINLEKVLDTHKKTWYNHIKNTPKQAGFEHVDIMFNSDGLVPFPGCLTGGTYPFMVR